MTSPSKSGNEVRIESLTDTDCPLRRSNPAVQSDGIDLLELLIGDQATVSDVENFELNQRRLSQGSKTNISKCAELILAGKCSEYGVQEVVLPDFMTDGVDLEDYEGLRILELIEDSALVGEIKDELSVGPRPDIEEQGAKVLSDDVLLG